MRADPVYELDGLIARLRAARDAGRGDLEQAIQRKVAALADEQRAQDDIDAARKLVRDCTAEIDQLLEERHALIPGQRQPRD